MKSQKQKNPQTKYLNFLNGPMFLKHLLQLIIISSSWNIPNIKPPSCFRSWVNCCHYSFFSNTKQSSGLLLSCIWDFEGGLGMGFEGFGRWVEMEVCDWWYYGWWNCGHFLGLFGLGYFRGVLKVRKIVMRVVMMGLSSWVEWRKRIDFFKGVFGIKLTIYIETLKFWEKKNIIIKGKFKN